MTRAAVLSFCVALLACLIAPVRASVPYSVTVINPDSETSGTDISFTDYSGIQPIMGIDHGQVSGWAGVDGFAPQNAVLWDGTRLINLSPDPSMDGDATGISGGQQVGWVGPVQSFRATLWHGSAASAIDLHPVGFQASAALATNGTQEVGLGYLSTPPSLPFTHALLWSGTASSVVDLHPASGFDATTALAIDSHQQVGYGTFSNPAIGGYRSTHALVWSGTAASMIDLNPGAAYTSYAAGVWNGEQVGAVAPLNQPPPLPHQLYGVAAVWHGSAGSWVSLHPTGYDESAALATNGPEQVGFAFTAQPYHFHALLWHGTAGSAVDLDQFLPAGLDSGWALAIDRDGNVAGLAYQSTPDIEINHMVVWTPHRSPGDVNLDGTVDFSDLLTLAQHYGQGGGWIDGDMNGDGTVNFADLLALAQNYGQMTAETYAVLVGAEPASVPEPGFTPLLIVVACVVGARVRRSRKAEKS